MASAVTNRPQKKPVIIVSPSVSVRVRGLRTLAVLIWHQRGALVYRRKEHQPANADASTRVCLHTRVFATTVCACRGSLGNEGPGRLEIQLHDA